MVDEQHRVTRSRQHLKVEREDVTEAGVGSAVDVENGRIGCFAAAGFEDPALDLYTVGAREQQMLNGGEIPLSKQVGIEPGELPLVGSIACPEMLRVNPEP